MYFMNTTFMLIALVAILSASIEERQPGWLTRFVPCYKATSLNISQNTMRDCNEKIEKSDKFEDKFNAGSQDYLEDARIRKRYVDLLCRFFTCDKTQQLKSPESATKDFQEKKEKEFEAIIVPKPKGYQDSKNWTFESVSRLLTLISKSEKASPLRRTLRRMLQLTNTRRFNIPLAETFKRFPSLLQPHPNEFYYDASAFMDSEELAAPADDSLIIIGNPVESQLPSKRLSVNLLKDIMIQRARSARKLPSTVTTQIPWDTDRSNKPYKKATTKPQVPSG